MTTIKTLGIAGSGVIGAGWAARAMAHGINVIAYDPFPQSEQAMREKVERAWPSMFKLMGSKPDNMGTLSFTTDLKQMCQGVDWIQEAAPEREDLKISLYEQMDQLAGQGRYHCIVFIRLSANAVAVKVYPPRTRDHRPSVLPGVFAASGGDRGR